MKELVVGGESHTHSSQHFPGTLTRRGMGQSGLGSRTSMPQSGTQPTAPSRHVHWYLQLLWNDSPLRYTFPPNTQGAPSRAVVERSKKLLTRRKESGTIVNVMRISCHSTVSSHMLKAYQCRLQCVGCLVTRSHSRDLCEGRTHLSQCTALPAV